MPVLHSPESEFARESVKWEAYPTAMGPGLRPYVRRLFPQMLYRADRVDGHVVIVETAVAESEVQASNYASRGFHPGPDEAIAAQTSGEREIARAAAERAFHEQRMSPQAQAEAARADHATAQHLPSVPETPVRSKKTREKE